MKWRWHGLPSDMSGEHVTMSALSFCRRTRESHGASPSLLLTIHFNLDDSTTAMCCNENEPLLASKARVQIKYNNLQNHPRSQAAGLFPDPLQKVQHFWSLSGHPPLSQHKPKNQRGTSGNLWEPTRRGDLIFQPEKESRGTVTSRQRTRYGFLRGSQD